MQDIETLLANEETKEKLIRSIRRLKAKMVKEEKKEEEEEVKPYTLEEFRASVAKGVADARAGRETSSEQVFKRMEEKYKWLQE